MAQLIAGNWKMNGLKAAAAEVEALAGQLAVTPGRCEVLICPPATLLAGLAERFAATPISFGGQDCHAQESGAHTGDVAAEMLADAGASHVIVGHSERRADHGESNETVRAKALAAQRAGLTPIVCVGEVEAERRAGNAIDVVKGQLAGSLPGAAFVVAYEPVWAIGTGLTPTAEDIAEMHAAIRGEVGADAAILYGGSVKPGNAGDILAIDNVGGALVGGASLKAADFGAIVAASA